MNIEELDYQEKATKAVNHVVLFQPQIPQNTGNIARTCAATNTPLNPEKALRIPMNDEHVRSLNLSNTVCMIVYEALRQQAFPNLELSHTYEHDKLK